MTRATLSEQFTQESTLLWPLPLQWLYAALKKYAFCCLLISGLLVFWFVKSYYHAQELAVLEAKREALKQEIAEVQKSRLELTNQLNSESDLSWQELSLMRVLGVKPEGYTKVMFR